MMRSLLLGFILVFHGPLSIAQVSTETSASEKLNSLFERAMRAAGRITEPSGRKVVRGAKPEIMLSKGRLYFNAKELYFKKSIADWRSIIGAGAHCSPPAERPGWCKWDELGLEILGTVENPHAVEQFTLYLSRDPSEGPTVETGGAPWLARGVFRGYLQIENIGIDSKTEFSDIRVATAAYNVQCGALSCRHPRGAYGNDLSIYLLLAGDDDRSVIREVTLSSE